jgi:acetylornithine deacetylase/succinyl-diaminopimelate desuccinylase-like protein
VTPPGISEHGWDDLVLESVDLLRRLLRVDTTNPPGNETACAELLRDYFAAAGIDSRLVGHLPHRQNLVARLKGRRDGPTLLLLGHLDVVPAEPEEWSVPPFSGELRDGYIWGRGATDMKFQVCAQAVACARLARAGADFAGEVLYVATADEEVGDYCGASWLASEMPDLVRCDYLLNEGGGTYVHVDGRRLYTYTVGEKAFAQFVIHTRGRGGHGSVPLHDQNAVETMGRVVAALADHELPVTVTPLTTRFIDRLVTDRQLAARLKDPGGARAAIRDMLAAGDETAYLVEPLLGITFSPTIARAGGQAVNVIPSHAEITIDCRILPGQVAEDVRAQVAAALRDVRGAWDLEIIDITEGNESPASTPLSSALERVLCDMVPDADLVPTLLCGFTDSRWFRETQPHAVAYGFCPFFAEDSLSMGGREHAADERIAAADVPLQALFTERVVHELLR